MTNSTRKAGEACPPVYRPWTPGCTVLLKSIAADANMAEWASNPTMPEFLSSAADALSDLEQVIRDLTEAVGLLRLLGNQANDAIDGGDLGIISLETLGESLAFLARMESLNE
jgi:hypothetical protein